MPSLDAILKQLANEAPVITGAPLSFVVAVLIGSGIAFLIARWMYATVITHKNAEISSLEKMVKLRDDQLSNKLQSLPTDEARAMIQALEARIAANAPRRLTDQQATTLRRVCALAPSVEHQIYITADMACSDCGGYAAELNSLFNKIPGWKCDVSGDLGMEELAHCGMALAVEDAGALTPVETLIKNGLEAAGLQVEILKSAYAARDAVSLLITRRDQPFTSFASSAERSS